MDLFRVGTLPFLARRNYSWELAHLLPWAVLVGLVEGQFASIVVAETFDGGKLLVTLASAAPPASYLFSLYWGMLCVGRRKLRLFTLLGSGMALTTGTVGLTPTTSAGAIVFIGQMAAAQILLAGVVTVRSAIWRSNYPRMYRGRITARLEAVRFVIGLGSVLLAAHFCDRDPTSYRYIFPAAAVCGILGVLLIQRMRIRGERHHLRRLREASGADFRLTMGEPFSLTALLSPGRVFGRMAKILRNDRRFARYCTAQSFIGLANLMTLPVVVLVVTRNLGLSNHWSFWVSTGLIQALPQLLRIGSLGRWAALFDRVGVVRFRVVNVSIWALSLVFGLLGTVVAQYGDPIGPWYLPAGVACFALRGLGNGIGLGAGSLAWTIGHLHFARADEAEVYMGIHVFLTGLRGLTAPFVGVWLFHVFGWGVWLVALILSLCSLMLYRSMARQEAARAPSPGETPAP